MWTTEPCWLHNLPVTSATQYIFAKLQFSCFPIIKVLQWHPVEKEWCLDTRQTSWTPLCTWAEHQEDFNSFQYKFVKKKEHKTFNSSSLMCKCLTWVGGPCPLLSSGLHSWSDSPGHPWNQRVHHQRCGRRYHPSLGRPHLLPASLVLHSGHKVPSFQGWSVLHRQNWFLWTIEDRKQRCNKMPFQL